MMLRMMMMIVEGKRMIVARGFVNDGASKSFQRRASG